MVTTRDQYATGNRHVRAGSEDGFAARWQAFIIESAKAAQGFGSARLLRDADDPRHFLSFSDWPTPRRGTRGRRVRSSSEVSRRAASSATSSRARTPRRWRASRPRGLSHPSPPSIRRVAVSPPSIGSLGRAAFEGELPSDGRPKFRPQDTQARPGACRKVGDGTNGWAPTRRPPPAEPHPGSDRT